MPEVHLSRNYTFKGDMYLARDNPQDVPEELAERDKQLSGGAADVPEDGSPEAGAETTDLQEGEMEGGTMGGEAAPTEPQEGETELPDSFPHVEVLRDSNFHTYESLQGINLQSITGIGETRAEDIAEVLEDRRSEVRGAGA